VYENKNPRSKTAYPLLVDAQADLLDDLQTRVVIPPTKAPALTKRAIARLTPPIEIDSEQYLLMTPQLAGIARSELGPAVGNVGDQRARLFPRWIC
jgi:toxin CcdB